MVDFTKLSALNPATDRAIEDVTRKADAEAAQADAALEAIPIPPVIDPDRRGGLSKLIDEDFPFDESQLAAINGLKNQRFGCLTGAAGTGKTTCLKKLVDEVQDSLPAVDMNTYWRKSETRNDDGDDYEVVERFVPSVVLCSFTGRASQMIKKNFPRDWHGNIMTIHRMLAYMPEYYMEWDEERGEERNKMRFIPTYTAANKMPWDIIVMDEAGMTGLELYEQVRAAMKEGARLYLIGDINQLPPTHGKSIFGFAMAKWPSWELTHIHRQKVTPNITAAQAAFMSPEEVEAAGFKSNSIVENAWKVLKGLTPKGDDVTKPDWKFAMMPLPGDANTASRYLRAWLEKIKGPIYDPIRDTIITPINAYEQCQGYALGQDPLNRNLALMFNSSENRYIIDAGRERKYFAEGDKVMATRNDYEANITNGMTGIITSIARNGDYMGDTRRFDTIKNVNAYLAEESESFEDEPEISLDDLANAFVEDEEDQTEREQKEKRDRGPASHIVTVTFGEGDHAFSIPFATLAEVASLMTAYVVTCHKMQGGEAPTVIIILHQSHKRMLFREWLYTAITRASQRCIVLYTNQALMTALNKQNIKGSTLEQKVQAFVKLQEKGIAGASVTVNIPEPESLTTSLVPAGGQSIAERGAERTKRELMALAADDDSEELAPAYCSQCKWPLNECQCGDAIPPPQPVKSEPWEPHLDYAGEPMREGEYRDPEIRTIILERVIRETVERAPVQPPEPMNGGDLTPEKDWDAIRKEGLRAIDQQFQAARMLPAPPRLIPQVGAVLMQQKLEDDQRFLRLTYQPKSLPPGEYNVTLAPSYDPITGRGARVETAVVTSAAPKPGVFDFSKLRLGR